MNSRRIIVTPKGKPRPAHGLTLARRLSHARRFAQHPDLEAVLSAVKEVL